MTVVIEVIEGAVVKVLSYDILFSQLNFRLY